MQAMDRFGIAAGLVMPQPTLDNVFEVHSRIGDMMTKYPQRIYGMTSLDPWLAEDIYVAEVERCIKELGFVAIKLHPLGHNISPLSKLCNKIYELAELHQVPVLVHTGTGNPFSLPSLMIDPAKRYPGVSFILCHAGFAVYADEAIVAAKHCDNIYLEPSWCQTYMTRKMIDQVGLEKIIMGSDHISNLPVELAKYNNIGLSDEQLEAIFYNNPKRIFKLEEL
ncbi:hypothetical protein PRIO_3526 [Paenibacillus riograndensis SBR5]|uniref:Amidohydrolase-related domain-containing protein n=2 Tax=Paenibacillus riograndensis TaxID=483937 RepID=A0A0E4HEB6_9BACL|nr:hypothetical protein PRIO_3526 [Paenibacillus riograndensis SBR5]